MLREPVRDKRYLDMDELRYVRDTFPKGSRKRVTAVYRDFWR